MLEDKKLLCWRRVEDIFKTCLEDVFLECLDVLLLCLQKTSLRRLDQDEYIYLTHMSSEDVFKRSSRRFDLDQYNCLGHTSSRRLQHVFKTSCKSVFETSSRRLQDVSKLSSRRLQDVLQRSLQGTFKTYHQVKLFLLTGFQKDFETYSKRF